MPVTLRWRAFESLKMIAFYKRVDSEGVLLMSSNKTVTIYLRYEKRIVCFSFDSFAFQTRTKSWENFSVFLKKQALNKNGSSSSSIILFSVLFGEDAWSGVWRLLWSALVLAVKSNKCEREVLAFKIWRVFYLYHWGYAFLSFRLESKD